MWFLSFLRLFASDLVCFFASFSLCLSAFPLSTSLSLFQQPSLSSAFSFARSLVPCFIFLSVFSLSIVLLCSTRSLLSLNHHSVLFVVISSSRSALFPALSLARLLRRRVQVLLSFVLSCFRAFSLPLLCFLARIYLSSLFHVGVGSMKQ